MSYFKHCALNVALYSLTCASFIASMPANAVTDLSSSFAFEQTAPSLFYPDSRAKLVLKEEDLSLVFQNYLANPDSLHITKNSNKWTQSYVVASNSLQRSVPHYDTVSSILDNATAQQKQIDTSNQEKQQNQDQHLHTKDVVSAKVLLNYRNTPNSDLVNKIAADLRANSIISLENKDSLKRISDHLTIALVNSANEIILAEQNCNDTIKEMADDSHVHYTSATSNGGSNESPIQTKQQTLDLTKKERDVLAQELLQAKEQDFHISKSISSKLSDSSLEDIFKPIDPEKYANNPFKPMLFGQQKINLITLAEFENYWLDRIKSLPISSKCRTFNSDNVFTVYGRDCVNVDRFERLEARANAEGNLSALMVLQTLDINQGRHFYYLKQIFDDRYTSIEMSNKKISRVSKLYSDLCNAMQDLVKDTYKCNFHWYYNQSNDSYIVVSYSQYKNKAKASVLYASEEYLLEQEKISLMRRLAVVRQELDRKYQIEIKNPQSQISNPSPHLKSREMITSY